MKLYKKVYTVWSETPLSGKTIVDVAEEADSGDAFCSDSKTEVIEDENIPDEVKEFFNSEDEDNEDDEEDNDEEEEE